MTLDTGTIIEIIKWVAAIVFGLMSVIVSLILVLHKDMKKSIDKCTDLLHPLIRQVDIHEASIRALIQDLGEVESIQKEHEKVHRTHHDRISKLENKIEL